MNRIGFVLVGVIVLGCGSSEKSAPASTTSVVTGSLTMGSFPSAPSGVEATDETGAKVPGTIDGQGAFRLTLSKGHVYRLNVLLGGSAEPFVFPRAANQLDTTVRISTSAATVTLGAVRHFDAVPTAGFSGIDDNNKAQCQYGEQDDHADGECENGKDAVTGAPCVDEQDDGETNDDQADPAKPMAVPEHNAPDDIAGCKEPAGGDGDGETNDD